MTARVGAAVATVIVIASLAGAGAWKWNRSPLRAITRLGHAIHDHDTASVETLVDYPGIATDVAHEYARRSRAPADAIAQIRTIAMAAETYATDHSEYPAGPLADLMRTLVPKYAKALPAIDPWGSAYCYSRDSSRSSYRIASAGADREFASDSCVAPSLQQAATQPDLAFGADLVYGDGAFVNYPAVYNVSSEELAMRSEAWRRSVELQLRRLAEDALEGSDAAYAPSLHQLFRLPRADAATASVESVSVTGESSRAVVRIKSPDGEFPLRLRMNRSGGKWRIVGIENLADLVPKPAV